MILDTAAMLRRHARGTCATSALSPTRSPALSVSVSHRVCLTWFGLVRRRGDGSITASRRVVYSGCTLRVGTSTNFLHKRAEKKKKRTSAVEKHGSAAATSASATCERPFLQRHRAKDIYADLLEIRRIAVRIETSCC